jgi:hypothetical protein
VGSKLFASYLLLFALVVAVGGLAIFRLNQLNYIVSDVSGNLAVNQHLSAELEAQVSLLQFHALQYINQKDPADLDRYQEELTNFKDLLSLSQEKITRAEQSEVLGEIEARVERFEKEFAEATSVMGERQLVRDKVLITQAASASQQLDQLYSSAFRADDTAALYHIGNVRQGFDEMRLDIAEQLNDEAMPLAEKIEMRYQNLLTTFEHLNDELDDSAQERLSARAEANVAIYFEGYQSLRPGYNRQARIVRNLSSLSAQMRTAASSVSGSVEADIATKAEISNGIVGETQVVVLAIILVIIGVGLGFAAIVDRAVRSQLNQVPKFATGIAANIINLPAELKSKDGAKVVAAAINQITGNSRDRYDEESDLRKN